MKISYKTQTRTGRLLLAIAVVMLGAFLPVGVAYAQATGPIDCPDNEVAVSVQVNGSNCIAENGSAIAILTEIIRFLTVGVGVVTVGGIIYGALTYIWARDNAGQAQQGVTIITNTVIGLFLYIFMVAILNFIVPGGVFDA